MIARIRRVLLEVPASYEFPIWLICIAALGIFGYLIRTADWQPENFAVFLFDYRFGFVRRGLLGELVRLIPFELEEYYVYTAFYGSVLLSLYLVVLANLHLALFKGNAPPTEGKVWFSLAVLLSPLFLKNLMFDFGRFDSAGYLAVFGFALAPAAVRRVLIVVLPPVLILCHEAQIVLSVAPMLAIFLICAIHERDVFKVRTLAPLASALVVSLGLTFYIMNHLVPGVEPDIIGAYVGSKSAHNIVDRTWLLYDDLTANYEMAIGNRGFAGRQWHASPLYVLAFVLHLPIALLLWRSFARGGHLELRISCALIVLTSVAQCVLFVLGIDFARWIANIFISFVAMLLVLIRCYGLSEVVADHVSKHKHSIIALVFIFAAIPKFGVVSP